MKTKTNNADFEKAVDEEMKQSPFPEDEKFRLAIETIAREILIAAGWTNISPPAIAYAALGVIHRATWESPF